MIRNIICLFLFIVIVILLVYLFNINSSYDEEQFKNLNNENLIVSTDLKTNIPKKTPFRLQIMLKGSSGVELNKKNVLVQIKPDGYPTISQFIDYPVIDPNNLGFYYNNDAEEFMYCLNNICDQVHNFSKPNQFKDIIDSVVYIFDSNCSNDTQSNIMQQTNIPISNQCTLGQCNQNQINQLNPNQFNPNQFNPNQLNQFNPNQFNLNQLNPNQLNQFNLNQLNPNQLNQLNPNQLNQLNQFNPNQFNPNQSNPNQLKSKSIKSNIN